MQSKQRRKLYRLPLYRFQKFLYLLIVQPVTFVFHRLWKINFWYLYSANFHCPAYKPPRIAYCFSGKVFRFIVYHFLEVDFVNRLFHIRLKTVFIYDLISPDRWRAKSFWVVVNVLSEYAWKRWASLLHFYQTGLYCSCLCIVVFLGFCADGNTLAVHCYTVEPCTRRQLLRRRHFDFLLFLPLSDLFFPAKTAIYTIIFNIPFAWFTYHFFFPLIHLSIKSTRITMPDTITHINATSAGENNPALKYPVPGFITS